MLPAEFTPIIDALADAAALTKVAQQNLTAATTKAKADGSIVTLADYAAQALINHHLQRSGLPIPAMVSEESAAALHAEPTLLTAVVDLLRARTWPDATATTVLNALDLAAAPDQDPPPHYYTIDPIDGTKGFAAGRQYAVCLARIDRGHCTLAALACPNLSPHSNDPVEAPAPIGTIYLATDSSPVYAAPLNTPHALAPIPARPPTDIHSPRITFSVEPSEARLRNFDTLAALLGGAHTLPADSQAKYALVARSQADCYFRPPRSAREMVWDHAAGCLILQRAGCTVTDLHANPITWPTTSLPPRSGILAAPPPLHTRILRALGAFVPAR